MKASWLNLLHIESVSHVRERGDFIGSESHCEFIIAGKEQNVINEILNWLKKKSFAGRMNPQQFHLVSKTRQNRDINV